MGQILQFRAPPKPLTEGKRATYHNPVHDRCCKCGRACHSLNWGEMDSKTVTCVYCVDDRDMTDEGL
jgi:hypothetical protein